MVDLNVEYAQLAAEGHAAPDADWQTIAITLREEVERLRGEVDRLSDLGRSNAKAPLSSHADQGHPLWSLWVSLNLDRLDELVAAWKDVSAGHCVRCGRDLTAGPFPPFVMCEEDNLCFIASDGGFALDEIDRARDRGPDE